MKRTLSTAFAYFFFFGLFSVFQAVIAGNPAPLLTNTDVAPYGLEVAWFNQARVNPDRDRVNHAIMHDNTVIISTEDSYLHVIDAENGKTLWSRSLGAPNRLCLRPAANSRMVAIICGLEALVFDRFNGKLLWNVDLMHDPGMGCELSESYLYVSHLTGKMSAYYLLAVPGTPEVIDESGKKTIDTIKAKMSEQEDRDIANLKADFEKARAAFAPEPAPVPRQPQLTIDRGFAQRLVCPSVGKTLVQPAIASSVLEYNTVTGKMAMAENSELITWATDRGILHIASINRTQSGTKDAALSLRFQIKIMPQVYYMDSSRSAKREIEKSFDIAGKPTYVQPIPLNVPLGEEKRPSLVLIGTFGGYALAVKDRTGEVLWQFFAGSSILQRIAAVDDLAFISTSKGLYCLDLMKGEKKWYAQGIVQFFSASNERIYALSSTKKLVVLDRANGGILGEFPAVPFTHSLFNLETDRVYLITDSGLVQCLREIKADGEEQKPIRHALTSKEIFELQQNLRNVDAEPAKGAVPAGEAVPQPQPQPQEGIGTEGTSPFENGGGTVPEKSSNPFDNADEAGEGEAAPSGADSTEQPAPQPEPQPKPQTEEDPFAIE